MELTAAEKSARLRMAIQALEDADAWQQVALGDSDVCFENHNRIQDLIEDLEADIQELKVAV